jgi:hypothetical protein
MNKILYKIKVEYIDVWQNQSPSDRFKSAFKVFENAMLLNVKDRSNQARKDRSAWTRNPIDRSLTKQISNRIKYYDNLIQYISDDFIRSMKDIVFVHCDEIDNEALMQLRQKVSQILSNQLKQAKGSEARFVASIGRKELLKSIMLPVESKFSNVISSICEEIEYAVAKYNLEKQTEKIEYNRKRQLEVLITVAKWLPISGFITWLLSKLL